MIMKYMSISLVRDNRSNNHSAQSIGIKTWSNGSQNSDYNEKQNHSNNHSVKSSISHKLPKYVTTKVSGAGNGVKLSTFSRIK